MSEQWRLFIAIELPHDVLTKIGKVQNRLQGLAPERAARWTRPEGIHLTLKFLGDTPTTQLDDLRAALDAAVIGHAPFDLYAEQLGAFPDTHRPRVLWVGLHGDLDALRALQSAVEEHIAPLGVPPEGRGFQPHLTLARTASRISREDQAALGHVVEQAKLPRVASWHVQGVSLIRSQLQPSGSIYTQIGYSPLKP
jgi:2'-5' RNA ligase